MSPMIYSKKSLAIGLIVIVLAAAGYFLFLDKGKGKNRPEDNAETAQSGSSPAQKPRESVLPVKVLPASRGELVIKLKSPGEAVTEKRIVMKTEVSGTIKNLNVREGLHVREGDLLLEIEDREYRLKLERAEATRLKSLSELLLEKQFSAPEKELESSDLDKLRRAEEAFSQAASRFSQGLMSAEEFEKIKSDYELVLIESGKKKDEVMASAKQFTQAEIDVKMSRLELEKTKIRAPFSGMITEIKVSPKENLSAGREIFTLVDISQIKVQARVLESEIGKIRIGREAELRFSAYPDKIFQGKVEAVSPVINPTDRTCMVQIAVDNPREEIKPGMHAEVEIAADVYANRLLVPQEAILVRGGRKLVFVVEEGLAKWRYIEVGLENEEFAEVLDGVKEGELVIVEGHLTLAHDARVEVAKE